MTTVMAATATYSLLLLLLAVSAVIAESAVHRHVFTMTRLRRRCHALNVATVNGQLPGPTIEIRNGDTLEVLVRNRGKYNATIHWHGVRQMRSAWSDGPEYITQCPIRPGAQYTYRFTIGGQEGTLWWHAHSSWLRATVYGALIIRPALGDAYPFAHPVSETPILLGEWWNANPIYVVNNASRTGGPPNVSEAFTINGLPGDKYPRCPKNRHNDATFTMKLPAATKPQTHLLRIVNAAVNTYLFFKVAGHNLTVVGADASYTKPYTTDVLMLGPGQSTDATFIGRGHGRFYMAASAYSPVAAVQFDNTTTTAILEYGSANGTLVIPKLPAFNDTQTANTFVKSLRSLGSREHPVYVPTGNLDESLFYTVGLGLIPCSNSSNCGGPNNTRLAASMNNQSFVLPQRTSVLQAHRFNVKGVFTADFPSSPPVKFKYTANNIRRSLWTPVKATKVKVVKYNATVQIVLQGTNIFAGESHPIHLHGHDFYVVGIGSGNYNPKRDPAKFNLVDPPMRNTVTVPMRGWAAIRFVADNPGAWLMHCHLDVHLGWGLATVFVVPDGAGPLFSLEAPPPDLPPC